MSDTFLDECEAMAEAYGLHYGNDEDPGIARRRCGRGFRYLTNDGEGIDPGVRTRIDDLAIPPAWTDVWISADPASHLQATGRDDRDRKQYVYHERWRQLRDEAKFEQLASFSSLIVEIRKRVEMDLDQRGLGRERATAAVVALLDSTLIRVGNERYAAENDTFGATTLEGRHVARVDRGFKLEFTGKSDVERSVAVHHRGVVKVIEEALELGQPQLFCFVSDDGSVTDLNSAHVNEYLAATAGDAVTAKTFRTWGATTLAVDRLGSNDGPESTVEQRYLDAIDTAAAALGNTRAVCRNCYVAPMVADALEAGELDQSWRTSRNGRWRTRAENTAAKLLG